MGTGEEDTMQGKRKCDHEVLKHDDAETELKLGKFTMVSQPIDLG